MGDMLERYEAKKRRVEGNDSLAIVEVSLVKEDFFYFLKNWVVTQDEHNLEDPFKQMPVYDYMRHIMEAIWSTEIVWVAKSRQIMITWLFTAYTLWMILYKKGVFVAIFSKQGDDANDILDNRGRFIYDWIPSNMKPAAKFKISPNASIRVPQNNSKASAFPSKSGQVIRSRSPTFIFLDEASYMDELAKLYQAALPATKGGGRLVGVSSAGPSYYEKLLMRRTEPYIDKNTNFILNWENMDRVFSKHSRGIIDIDCPEHNTKIIWVHYTAQLQKSTAAWKINAVKGYDENQWLQEMEIDFSVDVGDLVFEGFPTDDHIIEPFKIPDEWWKGRALDVGFRNETACLWFAINPKDNILYIYRDYYRPGRSTFEHKRNILPMAIEDLPEGETDLNRVYFIQIIDPQSQEFNQSEKDGLTSIMMQYAEEELVEINGVEYDAGIVFVPGGKKPVDCIYKAIDLFAAGKIKIFNHCLNFIREISSYSDPGGHLQMNPKKKPRVRNDHLIDCLLFILGRVPMELFTTKPTKEDVSPIEKHIKSLTEYDESEYDFNLQ